MEVVVPRRCFSYPPQHRIYTIALTAMEIDRGDMNKKNVMADQLEIPFGFITIL